MLGSGRERSSPTTSRRDRWRAFRRDKSPKRAMSIETGTSELTTGLPSLPGLEVAPAATQTQKGHWLERGPQKRPMVFSGRSHPALAQRIAAQLGVDLGAVELGTFANGEPYCRYCESIRGADG